MQFKVSTSGMRTNLNEQTVSRAVNDENVFVDECIDSVVQSHALQQSVVLVWVVVE